MGSTRFPLMPPSTVESAHGNQPDTLPKQSNEKKKVRVEESKGSDPHGTTLRPKARAKREKDKG